jgi:capsid protein
VGEHTTGVRTALATDWSAGDGTELARRFVEDFTAYWDDNRPVLWMRNVAAQDGDDRFREIRNRSLDPIATGVTHQIEVGQAEGRVDPTIAPQALATALMMLVERMGMMYPGVEWRGVTRDEMVRAVTYIFERTVVGVPPPPA